MDSKVGVIGVGKLGLCLSLNIARAGYKVVGVDKDKLYVDTLNNKSLHTDEPLVEDYLSKTENIVFTTAIEEAIEADVIFIVVPTPSTTEWKYDHTFIEDVSKELINLGPQKSRKEVVINCTTFPGYVKDLQSKLLPYNYYVSYNPEFIAQGSIIEDQLNADQVLIGEYDKLAGDKIQKVYSTFMKKIPQYNRMSVTEAEITKLAVNCFLTTKISYANMIGDIARQYGCDETKILNSIGSDTRIGSKYLKYGFGFGGPCFPRDNRALIKCAEEVNLEAPIASATDKMNKLHLDYQIKEYLDNNPVGSTVNLDYITYKKGSSIIEESQRLLFATKLKELGYKIKVQELTKQLEDLINNLEK